MSSKNNVNKDFYTIAGRDRPNEDLVMARSPRDDERGRRGDARRRTAKRQAAPGRRSRRAA
jgi:hypothetical protein